MSAVNPCDFFENLDFPMDFFAPPQRPEFVAGISGNIAPTKKESVAPAATKMVFECTPIAPVDDNCGCGKPKDNCGYGRY